MSNHTPQHEPEEVNGYPLEMVFVEGGSFMMGDDDSEHDDEKPAHEVKLSDFYLGKYPVSQGLWKAVMGENQNPAHFKGDQLPVEQVSWDDIQDFLKKLNDLSEYMYVLPSEAQWEYAARGGIYQEDHTYTYAGSNEIEEVAWYARNNDFSTMPPGLKAPNALGLYDMSGNVLEWCQDIFDDEFYKSEAAQKPDPINDNKKVATSRLVRGGSWFNLAFDCRVSYRYDYDPGNRYGYNGFRLSRAS